MTLLLDDTLVTAFLTVPLTETWLELPVPAKVIANLRAADVGPGDVALISAAEATLLTDTHVLVSDVAVVLDGIGPIVMRTAVRPDGVEDAVVRLYDTGPTAELLIRALLRPYFGITARSFVTSDEAPEAAEASIVILDGAAGISQPEAGFQEDLSKGWFVLMGQAVVSHVVVVGVEVLARGAEPELEALRRLVAIGTERKRDVRSVMANRWGIEDREALGEMTNRQRFALTAADRNSLATLIARGTWGSRFGKRLPAYSDALDPDVRPSTGAASDDD